WDDNVGGIGPGQKLVEQMVVGKGIAQPDVVAIGLNRAAEQGIGNDARLMTATPLFRVAGVMNVAENQDRLLTRHDARMLEQRWRSKMLRHPGQRQGDFERRALAFYFAIV